MIFDLKVSGGFDLDKTLNCGQCFRWYKDSDFWIGVVGGHKAKVRLDGKVLKLETDFCDEEFWSSYFDLDFDYERLSPYFFKFGSVLAQAASENFGIHILKQEPWETLCSFIISQNNNIPRIKSIIERFCENFGTNLGGAYSFPDYKSVAQLEIEDLAPIKAGFRAKYIINAARQVLYSNLNFCDIKTMNTEEALRVLQLINGVGPKVAACTMLYAFHRLDCFPVDVWIKKVMDKYFKGLKMDFGEYRGLAQMYLFNWSRSHPDFF